MLSVNPRTGGVDSVLHSGRRVDVKQTKYPNGRLLRRISDVKDNVDIYVLMVGQLPTYRFVGWCNSDDLINNNSIIDLGYGPTYGKEQDELSKTLPE